MNDFPLYQDSACIEVQDNLEAYLAHELDVDLHVTLATHVASCSVCQNEVRLSQAIDKALHELPRLEPPPQVFSAISAYVRAHPNKGPRWLQRLFPLFTFSDDLTSTLARAGALVCLVGMVLFGTYQYQQHLKVQQASRDLTYALSKLNYAVERANVVVSEKVPHTGLNQVTHVLFPQIEDARHRALEQSRDISLAIHRSLNRLNWSNRIGLTQP